MNGDSSDVHGAGTGGDSVGGSSDGVGRSIGGSSDGVGGNGDGMGASDDDMGVRDDGMGGSDDGVGGNGAGVGGNGAGVGGNGAGLIPRFDMSQSGAVDVTGKEPVEIFKQYFGDCVIQHMLDETDCCGDQYIQSHQHHLDTHPCSRGHDFVKLKFDKGDILRSLVLIFAMRLVDMRSISNYWSTQWPFQSTNFNKILSQDRFILLLKFFHLADNSRMIARGDGHIKIREFINMIVSWFLT